MRQDPRFANLFIVDHPLIQHKLSHMRDRETSTRTFRQLLREITLLMGYEVTRNLPLTARRIETPLTAMDAPVIAGRKPYTLLTPEETAADAFPGPVLARLRELKRSRDPQGVFRANHSVHR